MGHPVSIKKIKEDIKENDLSNILKNIISKYTRVLDEVFLTKNLKACNPNLRNKAVIQSSQTRYLRDPSKGIFH